MDQIEEENRQLKESITLLEEALNALVDKNDQLVQDVDDMTKLYLPIYARDIDTDEIVELSTVSINKVATLEEKLQALADGLSEASFEGLPIDVLGIELVNNEQIVVVDLKDAQLTWLETYFQGSLGADMTYTALTETFLQPDYKASWIDGVQFVYNGQELMSDHMVLGDIIYRD